MITRTTETTYDRRPDGAELRTETETSALNSVEIKEDAKGQLHPEVKVYHNDIHEAARLALEVTFDLRAKIAEAMDQKLLEQLAASLPAKAVKA